MSCVICAKALSGKQTKYCSKNCKNKDTNHLLRNYTIQAAKAIRLKSELIAMAGGKCVKCGYYKNQAALHFHHLRDKSFEIDARHLANSKRELLIQELAKCILLCANCHMEAHYPQLSNLNCSGSGS
jgi:hypothetical protein